jgi:hydrogenase maturation protease
MEGQGRILIFGYGNPGRGDDGAGPLLAAALRSLNLPQVEVESDYQLSVDDALAVCDHAAVIFVDADVNGPPPFRFSRVQPVRCLGISGHSATPSEVMGVARDIFAEEPPAYMLGVRGYDFDHFRETLSSQARANVREALAFLSWALTERHFDDYVRAYDGHSPLTAVAGGAP